MIKLEQKYFDEVVEILERIIPGITVWAFGSRVHGKHLKPFSDLDLVIVHDTPLEISKLARLKNAFSESDLPIKVDLVEWIGVDDNVRKIIKENNEILQ